MTIQLPPLPKLLRVACKVGGMEAVQALSEVFGGKQIKIPKRCGDDHPLVQAGGRAVADAICAAFAPDQVEFPRGGKTLRMWIAATMLDEGATMNELVAALRISHREARRLKKKIEKGGGTITAPAPKSRPRDPRQMDIEDLVPATSRPLKGR